MSLFFVESQQIQGNTVEILGNDVNHMKNVLRLKVGDLLEVRDGTGCSRSCVVDSYEPGKACLTVIEEVQINQELSSRLVLFQGLPKSDKMEWIIQKAVELGVAQIIPVRTARTVVRLDEKKAGKKLERWKLISESAAKQSGREYIPEVSRVMDYEKALEEAQKLDVGLIPYECAGNIQRTRQIVREIKSGQSVGIFIGPEGGFDKEEICRAKDMGLTPITLGRRILRTETAGLAILSVLMMELEE